MSAIAVSHADEPLADEQRADGRGAEAAPADANLLLPTGTRLLHIGPHKTGTTSLQSAFHLARREVAAQGVHYAGRNAQPMGAAYAITGQTPTYAQPTPLKRWLDLVAEIEGAGDTRVVISSEGFCDADEAAIRRIVAGLDRARLHVVITLRPLTTIFPSQYQQFVQGAMDLGFEDWLDAMLNQPETTVSPQFWRRHRHDQLVRRWADGVGPERVTVIVADDRDHGAVLRVFERMVGLREGTLVPEWSHSNRSLTRAELALVRALNAALRSVKVRRMAHNKLMRLGAGELIKYRSPSRDEPRLKTPPWALERIAGIEREIADGIAASGVRVVGDLDALTRAPKPAGSRANAGRAAAEAWPQISTAAAMGTLLTTGLARRGKARRDEPWPDRAVAAVSPRRPTASDVSTLSTSLLRIVLIARLRSALRSAIFGRAPRPVRAWRAARRASRRRKSAASPSIHSSPVEVE